MLSTKGTVLVVHVTLVKWNEHNNPTKSSEPSKHLRSNISHCFTWAVISNAPKNAKTTKNLETYIALWKRDLNEQKDLEMVSHREINDIMQTPKRKCIFSSFSFLYRF